jgi:hypothetical protein
MTNHLGGIQVWQTAGNGSRLVFITATDGAGDGDE